MTWLQTYNEYLWMNGAGVAIIVGAYCALSLVDQWFTIATTMCIMITFNFVQYQEAKDHTIPSAFERHIAVLNDCIATHNVDSFRALFGSLLQPFEVMRPRLANFSWCVKYTHPMVWPILCDDRKMFKLFQDAFSVPRLERETLSLRERIQMCDNLRESHEKQDYKEVLSNELHPVVAGLIYNPDRAWDLVSRGWEIPDVNAIRPFPGRTRWEYHIQDEILPWEVSEQEMEWNRQTFVACQDEHVLFPASLRGMTTARIYQRWLFMYDAFVLAHKDLCRRYRHVLHECLSACVSVTAIVDAILIPYLSEFLDSALTSDRIMERQTIVVPVYEPNALE